ncbi:MAG: BTAD domain-containing putative transcriptional regulator [Bacillota bacterium]
MDIYSLGHFKVKNSSEEILTNSARLSKRWKLFQYLITNCGKAVSRERLIRILDLEKNQDPEGALTALVYRLRKVLKNGTNNDIPYITTQGKAYLFNQEADYWLDAEVFASYCKKTQSLLKKEDKKAIETFKKALKLYQGDYLEETRTEEWVWSSRNYYRNLLIETVLQLDNFMQDKELYEDLWKIYENVLQVARFEEQMILGLIRALLNSGNQGLARIEYEEAINLFRENDLLIPPDLKKMGDKLNNMRKDNPASAMKNMKLREKEKGAFVCNPETFTMIYDLEKRRSRRDHPSGLILHLKMSAKSELLSDTEEAENKMKQVLKSYLRCGDVVCHWSQKHFILLLVNIKIEEVDTVFERIQQRFKENYIDYDKIEIEHRYYEI